MKDKILTLSRFMVQREYCKIITSHKEVAIFMPTHVHMHDNVWVTVGVEFDEFTQSDVLQGFAIEFIVDILDVDPQPKPIDID